MNLSNQLLIAMPDIQDSRFKQAVILICEHNENGAMGLVLNQAMELSTEEVFKDLSLPIPSKNHTVVDGGPLNKNYGFVLHNNTRLFQSSIQVSNNLTLTTSKDLMQEISAHNFTDPWQLFLGYSGWTKDQLENEIAENTWLTAPADLSLIFATPLEDKWQKALALIGIKNYQSISGVGHA